MSKTHAPLVAVAGTCLVAGLAYSGAVTGLALLTFLGALFLAGGGAIC